MTDHAEKLAETLKMLLVVGSVSSDAQAAAADKARATLAAYRAQQEQAQQLANLSDDQCDEFRRLPLSFRDMVRAIYAAGEAAALERAGQAVAWAAVRNGAIVKATFEEWDAKRWAQQGEDVRPLIFKPSSGA